MAITKTDFINFSKCPRYTALAKIHQDKGEADISYQDYKAAERQDQLAEIISQMYEIKVIDGEEEEIDKIDLPNEQLAAMLKYYKIVEKEASRVAAKVFGGKTVAAESTFKQESFDFSQNGVNYLCYVDIYNETQEAINIIEVKATTSAKCQRMQITKDKIEHSIWQQQGNFFYLKDEIANYPITQEMELDKYQKTKAKLFDRYHELGKYVYDLAVQRFIIEGEYQAANNPNIDKLRYYLGFLNKEYRFSGIYENDEPVYDLDENGNELIVFLDLTAVTAAYQEQIKQDAMKIEKYLKTLDATPCALGKWCGFKTTSECPYFTTVCGAHIPHSNSVLNYLNGGTFEITPGQKLSKLDLINEGYLDLLDIPEAVIENQNHIIQRDCYRFKTQHINHEKIKIALANMQYPIYHLDFETFPCPVPRFKGEWPYIQSPFEFSLHIESKPGKCDKAKDNFVFLAETSNDEREALIKALITQIDGTKGTLLAQNVSFEKGRIKELASIFPQYKKTLMQIYDRGFDLIWLLKSKKELYDPATYSKDEATQVNFYDYRFSGSYSIKKTLPVFSDLTYNGLQVKNGTEAIVEYANYPYMTKAELAIKRKALIEYCQQDTWAMVVILDYLRNIVK